MREKSHNNENKNGMDMAFPAKSRKSSYNGISDRNINESFEDFNNNEQNDDDSRSDDNNNGEDVTERDKVSDLNIRADNYEIVRDFSCKKFNREKEATRFKSNSAQSNITKLSPIKLQTSQFKGLGTKIKNKKEPLPMKLRALPKSFWLQPNQPTPFSPAPALPPLANISSNRYEENQACQNQTSGSRHSSVVSDANTELLFSLFNGVENGKRPSQQKRGRPRKLLSNGALGGTRDDDPCLVSSGLLPALAPAHPKPDNPKTLNYSQLLNELVIQL